MDDYKWITITLADYEEYLFRTYRDRHIRKIELKLLIDRSLSEGCKETFLKYTAQMKIIKDELKSLTEVVEQS